MEPNLKVNLLNDKTAIRTTHDWDAVKNIKCLICDRVFKLLAELDDYLGHLFLAHRIVISDVADIFLVEEYLDHWQGILNGKWHRELLEIRTSTFNIQFSFFQNRICQVTAPQCC